MHEHKFHLPYTLTKYFENKELDELYASIFLKSMADAFATVFIPVYLLLQGFGIRGVGVYYLFFYISMLFFNFLGMYLNHGIGIKKTMIVGSIAMLFYYYVLNNIQEGINFFIASIFFGVAQGTYYSAFHIEFSQNSDKKIEGQEVSIIKAITIIASIIAPLLGSLIIDRFSFNNFFFFVAIILFLSILPLLLTKDFKIYSKPDIKKILSSDTKRKGIAYMGFGAISTISAYFWPVFVFLVLKNIVSLGSIVSVSSLFLIIIILYYGKMVDKDNKNYFKLSVVTHAISWPFRLLLLTPLGLFFSNFFSSATLSMLDVAFNKIVYSKAKQTTRIAEYFLFRQINLFIGRALVLIIVILTGNLVLMFLSALVFTALHLTLLKEI